MENLIVLKNNFSEESEIVIAKKSAFEVINISETFNRYGQRVGNSNAGDHLSISKDFSLEIDEETVDFIEGQIISANDNHLYFTAILIGAPEDVFESHQETLIGYTYYDGHNYKTISIQVENGESTHTQLSEEESEKILKDYSSSKVVEQGLNSKVSEGDEFLFVEFNFQSNWELARVVKI